MQPGRWYRITGDRPDLGLEPTRPGTRYLADNDPATDSRLNPPFSLRERARRIAGRPWLAPWSGRVGFSAITEAWNGAVYAAGFGDAGSMVVYGGGHANYYGSDVHALDLSDRCWRRISDGYVAGAVGDYGPGARYPDTVYPDGSPLPPHTYNYIQYDPVGNDVLLLKGQRELGPEVEAATVPHLFNLDDFSWRRGPCLDDAIINSGGCSAWDSTRRILWGHSGDDGGGNAFVGFAPDGRDNNATVGRWHEFLPNRMPGEANHNAMQFDLEADRLVISLATRNGLATLDPANPSALVADLVSTGAAPVLRPYASLEYSLRRNRLIYYSAVDGPAVFAVTMEPDRRHARWESLTRDPGLDPVADALESSRYQTRSSHTFGRFRVAGFEDCDVGILVRHIDSPAYAIRLPESS